MTVHLVKLCAGADSIADLQVRVGRSAAQNNKNGAGRIHSHITRMRPRRSEELLDGGSMFWVIKGVIQARQKILGLDARTGADGILRTVINLDPEIILTEPAPRRAFQGWRYLPVEDAPKDLRLHGKKAPPAELQIELSELGLL